jgi:hypothetical protein
MRSGKNTSTVGMSSGGNTSTAGMSSVENKKILVHSRNEVSKK